jgi:aminocarboxymuconate-semialdehyde decarboxylase
MDELGMLGAAVPTTILGATLGDSRWDPFWAALDGRRAPVFIHAAGCGLLSPLIVDHGLTWSVGATFEDTLAVLHLLRAGVTVRYPNVEFIVAHLGGPLSFLLQRLDDNYDVWPNGFPDRPSKLLRELWYDTANFHAPALRCARDSFGADRLLLGTDFPLFDEGAYARAVDYVRAAGLPENEVAAILGTNAEAALGIGQSRVRASA